MIELRWLKLNGRTDGSVEMDLPDHYFKGYVRLQYRQAETFTKASGSFADPDVETSQDWSDWQDVPIVDEAD